MMIMLGNQTPDQIEKRLHIVMTEEHKKKLHDTWQQKAENIEKGKWHCFDIPFMFMCGDKDTAVHWRDTFMTYDLSHAELFRISWER